MKVFFKKRLKQVCPSIRSYHIKTLFYLFLEQEPIENVSNSSLEMLVKKLLSFLSFHLQIRVCPHYFISSLNLFDFYPKSSLDKVHKQMDNCVKIIKDSIQDKDLLVNIFPVQDWNKMLLCSLKQKAQAKFFLLFLLIVLLNFAAFLCGAFVYVVGFFTLLTLLVNFIYGAFVSLPVFFLIWLLFKVFKCFKKSLT